MSEAPENLILEMMRGMRGDVKSLRDAMHAEFADLKQRLTSVEMTLAGLKREGADAYESQTRMQAAVDALAARLLRVERRLELSDQ